MVDRISALYSRHDKHERWVALEEIEPYLSDREFFKNFVEIWIGSESNDKELPRIDRLIEKRRVCARNVMAALPKRERAFYESLPETIMVYRGTTMENPYCDYSWSTDREKAGWFGRRCSRATPALASGKVCKTDILFAHDGRGESEIAVRTHKVVDKSLRKIGSYKADPSFEIFSAAQTGHLDKLFPPEILYAQRIAWGVHHLGKTAEEIKADLYAEAKALADLGFRVKPTSMTKLLDGLDWEAVDLHIGKFSLTL